MYSPEIYINYSHIDTYVIINYIHSFTHWRSMECEFVASSDTSRSGTISLVPSLSKLSVNICSNIWQKFAQNELYICRTHSSKLSKKKKMCAFSKCTDKKHTNTIIGIPYRLMPNILGMYNSIYGSNICSRCLIYVKNSLVNMEDCEPPKKVRLG